MKTYHIPAKYVATVHKTTVFKIKAKSLADAINKVEAKYDFLELDYKGLAKTYKEDSY